MRAQRASKDVRKERPMIRNGVEIRDHFAEAFPMVGTKVIVM